MRKCILILVAVLSSDEDAADEDATDEDATEEDATDEDATDVHHPRMRISPG